MLAILGFSMVICFMYLIMTKRLSALIALIIVPIVFAVLGGHYTGLGSMMLDGVKTLAPTGVMLTFSILYFGIMIDAGLFDSLVRNILKLVKGDPLKVLVGTAILTMLVSLDGDSSTTYMIACAAFLPLYQRLGMNVLGLTCILSIATGIMNISPWGGPTARAAAALHVDALEIFLPMIPALLIAAATLVFTAIVLGRRERARLGVIHLEDFHNGSLALGHGSAEECEKLRRPKMFWPNLIVTLVLIACLVVGAMPIQILFMVGFAIAIVINYPRIEQQRERIAAHASNVLAVTALIFAAGIFTGILSGTGMVDAMAKSLLSIIPDSFGPFLAVFTALISMPLTFFMSNDAFYFGILPVIAHTAAQYGITPLEIARASIVGQPVHLLSPLVPALYLLISLAKVDLGDHQRFALKWAILSSLSLLAGGLLFGAFPLYHLS
ncbi:MULTISPECIES: CitMHS family transporter [unclassified Pseudomonas]|jgi:CitMHS family citrate-Mg2+:H+ or citrate-Ca2+:H+ symporter|uniref:CitMHS family transporter n=1 Tax=unclassified Pseudomonas TaxID=196821 RepID=UPI000C86D4C5|nr:MULTISPECIES: CitMHS family transporter [unclassified Pseudomonas]PMV83843.1 citrate transporter [Pseudomonas sp. GW101-1A09]PMV91416.1 citrate transporter [Pseudomonas sp. FW306-2-2C-B10A]PMV97667.1 citrate transporter [Pseudomonas sp. GW460-C8]PMW02357.1 citrate transporter [Pseudomonas sp. MPR-TSA4]PMW11734.1 citrate transporter [Pseudomonas sp. GW456-11-11-14-TSB2]